MTDKNLMKLILILILAILSSCGKVAPQKSSTTKQNVSAYFKADELKVKVFYEVGAEPYISDNPLFPYWNITEKNLEALFSTRSKSPKITVPKELSQMTQIPASGDVSWSTKDVLDLSKRMNVGSSNTFEIYFLNGYAVESKNIIGFHISGTRVMAIFKDVIRSSGSGSDLGIEILDAVPKYVEQSTIVHELGHGLGLVNNGVPMQTSHQDKEHGAHCNNPDCVMYWSNEGTSGLRNFVIKMIQKQTIIMFDNKCLQDTNSF